MNKFKTIIIIFMTTGNLIFAQEQTEKAKYGWQKELTGGLNLTQNKFDNWVQGGENSFAWQLNINFKFIEEQEKTTWATSGKMTYGNTKTGDQEARKSIDEIKLESVFTYKLGSVINPYISVNGETQFAPGYAYAAGAKTQISAFLDPGFLRESLGLTYKVNEIVQTRGGLSFKQTVTSDYPIPYTDDPQTPDDIELTRFEAGAESVTDVSWKINQTTLLTSKLELFTAFTAFDEIDVNWDNVLSAKIAKYFTMNFNFKLLYDKDISAKRQINQAFSFGLTYSFL